MGAVALVLDLAKPFERVSLPAVWACATPFSFQSKILRVLCRYFEHQRRVQVEGCAAEPLRTITTILPRLKWSCLLLRIVLQDVLSEVTNNYTPLKLRVFVDDDTTALLMEKNKEVAEMAKKVMRRLREEVGERASNCQLMKMDRKEGVRRLRRVVSWRMSCVNAAKKNE